MENKLTPRTRIEYRITTTPADFGYDGEKTGWLDARPACVGTPMTILDHAYAERRKYGEGVYYAEQFRTAAGVVISRTELEDYQLDVEYRRQFGR